jgi:hypothetical protein
LRRRGWVLVVLAEYAGTPVEHLAALGDLHFDLFGGRADRVRLDPAVRLDANEDRSIGLAIELLHIDAARL